MKKPVYVIPMPSTELPSEPRLVGKHLTFDAPGLISIEFQGVRAMRWRSESACTAWHVAECYDTLAIVDDPSWSDEVTSLRTPSRPRIAALHHYIIYLDSVGCYEFLAERYQVHEI